MRKLTALPDEEGLREMQAINQRQLLLDAADRIERGAELDNRQAIALAIRIAASNIPMQPRRRPGAKARFNHYSAARRYEELTQQTRPLTHTKAIEQIAEVAGVSVEAVKKALQQQGAVKKTKPKTKV